MPRPFQVKPPPYFLREIIDLIISSLISLYDHDPAYQWSRLRFITRFHKRELEHYFLRFWLPKLTIAVPSFDFIVDYAAWGINKKTGHACFKMRSGFNELQSHPIMQPFWAEHIMSTTYPLGDEIMRNRTLLIRLGVGVLSDGFSSGHIISDIRLPSLNANEDGTNIWFDWKVLFTRMFSEEMLMRKFRAKLLESYVPTIRATKPETRHSLVHSFLRERYQLQRREMLWRYRDHTAANETRFDFSPCLSWPRRRYKPGSFWHKLDIIDIVSQEESMVFQVPGWHGWNVREVACARAQEEMSWHNLNCQEIGANGLPDSATTDEQIRWDRWLGRTEASDETLREELKVVKLWKG